MHLQTPVMAPSAQQFQPRSLSLDIEGSFFLNRSTGNRRLRFSNNRVYFVRTDSIESLETGGKSSPPPFLLLFDKNQNSTVTCVADSDEGYRYGHRLVHPKLIAMILYSVYVHMN